MLDSLFDWLTLIGGALACLSVPVAVMASKGGGAHRAAGRVFFLSMITACGGVIWSSLASNSLLILLIAILAGYLVISGYRILYLKRAVPRSTIGPTRPGALDKGLAQFTLIACCATVAWGVMVWYQGLVTGLATGLLAPAMIVVGLAGAMLALRDMRRFRQAPGDPHHWLPGHAGRMLAGATGAFTGAGLELLTMLPPWGRWAVPVAIGAVLTLTAVAMIKRRIAGEGDPRGFYTVRLGELEPGGDLD